MQIEDIRGDWESLEAEWDRLWRELPNPTPFQSYAWIVTGFRAFESEGNRVLLGRNEGRVVGLLPMAGRFLAGWGISDYQDVLAAPECAPEVVARLIEKCGETCFENLRRESPLWNADCEEHELCPVLEMNSIPKAQRENVRYCTKRAEKAGVVTFELATRETLEEFLDALFRLHRARWETRGEGGVLQARQIQMFHRLAAPGLLKSGVLRLYAMRLNGAIVGAYLGYICRQRAFYYLSGFEPSMAALSPGTLLIAHAISEAAREGATHFDFLRGAEAYKYRWGAVDTRTYRRKIVSKKSGDGSPYGYAL